MLTHAGREGTRMYIRAIGGGANGAAPARRRLEEYRSKPRGGFDEAIASERTRESVAAALEALRSGGDSDPAPFVHDAVSSWRADNAAGGRNVIDHEPLPNALAQGVASLLQSVAREDRDRAADSLTSKLDPGAHALARQQILRALLTQEAGSSSPHRLGSYVDASPLLKPDSGKDEAFAPEQAHQRLYRSNAYLFEPYRAQETDRVGDPDQKIRRSGASTPAESSLLAAGAPRAEPPKKRWRRGDPSAPYDPDVEDVAKELQFFSYDPALLGQKMKGWEATVVFDSRVPEGFSQDDVRRGRARLNKGGFGGSLVRRAGTREHAILIKGAEVSDLQWDDVLASPWGGADQVAEVAEDVFQQAKRTGVFDDLRKGGHLNIIGHSQGAPSAQLLGVYVVVRAIQEGLLTEEQALAAIRVRGYGGMGALEFVDHLRGPDGKPLQVPPSILDRIDSVTYILRDDQFVQEVPMPYVGDVYLVDTPREGSYKPDEFWAVEPRGRAHARSGYRAADYRTAKRDDRPRRGWIGEAKHRLGVPDIERALDRLVQPDFGW